MQGLPGNIDSGEMQLEGQPGVRPLPSGAYARWQAAPATPTSPLSK
jgi:hypothetical protein